MLRSKEMEIQCDVCSKEAASVFCCADDAALCGTCDRRVHRANKLAGKHRRFSLLLPSAAESGAKPDPLCDICQEKQGFIFCKEDRAILCKECDAPIHQANNITMKHSRFLLTGTRLSEAPISSYSAPLETDEQTPAVAGESLISGNGSTTKIDNKSIGSGSSSSISEYLIKMLPGWQVEDLLVDDAAAVAASKGIYQTNEMLSFQETDVEGEGTMEFPLWFPHVPEIPLPHLPTATLRGADVDYSRPGRRSEDIFAVPQIFPVMENNKRPRPSSVWYL